MADPTPYNRTYSFNDFQASNPSSPLPGISLDNELENVEFAINGTQTALEDIRRSDGALKNGIVTVDSLDATVAAGVGTGALASAAAAAASADAASDSAVAAAASATAADGSATAASGYAGNALTSRNEAEAEKILAQTARTGAQTARDYASQWATAAEGVDVDDGVNPVGKSSYHWAQVALGAATGALPDNSVGTSVLQDEAVTEPKLGDGAVSTRALADGSITDPKLPDYDPVNSASANKMRFQATSSGAAIAASVTRPLSDKISDVLNAKDFGVTADGVTDDTAAMVAALAAMEETGRILLLPPGTIMVDPDVLAIGDGSVAGPSSKNGQMIMGAGGGSYGPAGTEIKARSTSAGFLLEVKAVHSMRLSGVRFNCDGKVAGGVRCRSMNTSGWSNFSIVGWTAIGLEINCFDGPEAAPMWSATNKFSNFLIISTNPVNYAAGLVMDGVIGKNFDPHRNTFIAGVIQLPRRPVNTYGAIFRFCDSNTFIECDIGVYGEGMGFGVLYQDGSNPGSPYPQNQLMYGCSLAGGAGVYEINPVGIGPNFFVCHTTRDGEGLPYHAKLKGFSDDGYWFSRPEVHMNAPGLILRSRNGAYQYHVYANITDSVDGGFRVQRWNGSAFEDYLSIGADGQLAFYVPGVGLRAVAVGAPSSAGIGYRSLSLYD